MHPDRPQRSPKGQEAGVPDGPAGLQQLGD